MFTKITTIIFGLAVTALLLVLFPTFTVIASLALGVLGLIGCISGSTKHSIGFGDFVFNMISSSAVAAMMFFFAPALATYIAVYFAIQCLINIIALCTKEEPSEEYVCA